MSRKNVTTDEFNQEDNQKISGITEHRRGKIAPPETNRTLFQRYGRDGAAVYSLLTVAGVAAVGIDNPCLIIPEFENLGTEFGAESAADTGIHVNFWRRHNDHSFLVVLFLEYNSRFSYLLVITLRLIAEYIP